MVIRLFNSTVRIRHSLLHSLCVFVVISCSAQKTSKSTYSEDLSDVRPRYAVEVDSARTSPHVDTVARPVVAPTQYVNGKVDAVLDSIDRFNLTRKFVDGYTAQIYSGQKQQDAMNAKQKMSEEIPEMVANLQYIQPKFRVTVGHYFTKLEAQKDFLRLRRVFPNVILVPEKIQIK